MIVKFRLGHGYDISERAGRSGRSGRARVYFTLAGRRTGLEIKLLRSEHLRIFLHSKTAPGVNMEFHSTKLRDAYLIQLEPARDNRGFFARTFCVAEFAAHGLETNFPQHSISFSARKGTLRGMHYQLEPRSEAKLVRCTQGA